MVNLNDYVSIIHPQIIDGIEAYLVFDKPAYRIGSMVKAVVLLRNHGSSQSIDVKIVESSNNAVLTDKLMIGEGELVTKTYDLPIGDKEGVHEFKLVINNKVYDTTKTIICDPSSRKPLYLTIVWHHHQAPNYTPDGRIHSPWAYIYVWGEQLKPYGKGPYNFHAVILKKHPHFKATYNLSPSLLYQWRLAIERGIEFIDGKKYDPSTPEIMLVKETLDSYIDSLNRGQIDVLTSIYAHTIAGFLTDVMKAHDIVYEEIAYGKKITEETMGSSYEAQGIWTPEMAFSMDLIPIYYDNGIRYTVLDEVHHFNHAEGDKNSIYEPYIVVDTSSGKYIYVFFRDSELSNIMSFNNNFYNEIHAWRNAYEYSLRIAYKWFIKEAKSLVIALDGENWMIFSKNPPATAIFLDKLAIYLETLQDMSFFKLSTLREIMENIPASKVLTNIPTNTWLGTFRKWRGERQEHEQYWVRAYEIYRKINCYEKLIGGKDQDSRRARWSLWHALDSDYWWAEFWSPNIINMWLAEARNIVESNLKKVRIREAKVDKEPFEDEEFNILVIVDNELDKDIYVTVTIGSPGLMMLRDELKPLIIKAKSSYARKIPVKATYSGLYLVVISLVSNGVLIDSKTVKVNIKPKLPPNPR